MLTLFDRCAFYSKTVTLAGSVSAERIRITRDYFVHGKLPPNEHVVHVDQPYFGNFTNVNEQGDEDMRIAQMSARAFTSYAGSIEGW